MLRFAIGCLAGLVIGVPFTSAQECSSKGVSVQILGSGGPLTGPHRASSSYLVWVDGRARVLVDFGGGAFLRLGESHARFDNLYLVGITHLHPDHVTDLPALLWLSDALRTERLAIVGPSGNDAVPGFAAFLERLFNAKDGAFPMLGGTLGGSGRGVPLDVSVVDVTKQEPSMVFDRQGVTVTAVGVPHGTMPAVGYRVRAGDSTVVFSGDQTGADPRFIQLAKDADVLVMHLALAAGESSPGHASPSVVGRVAQEARVRRLIVSHLGPGSAGGGKSLQPEFDLGPALAEVKKHYNGPVTVGKDLQYGCAVATPKKKPGSQCSRACEIRRLSD
jgi:ribonuclease BN (tRNA processing enzyme)